MYELSEQELLSLLIDKAKLETLHRHGVEGWQDYIEATHPFTDILEQASQSLKKYKAVE